MISFDLTRRILASTGVSLVALLLVVVTTTLVEAVRDLAADPSKAAQTIIELASYVSVDWTHRLVPVAVFFGAIAAFSTASRAGELQGIEASGVHPWVIRQATVAVGLLACLAMMAWGELALPESLRRLASFRRTHLAGQRDKLAQFFSERSVWFAVGSYRVMAPNIDEQTGEVSTARVYEVDGGDLVSERRIDRMNFTGSAWLTEGVRTHGTTPPFLSEQSRESLEIPVTPAVLIQATADPRHLRSQALTELIDRRELAGFDTKPHRFIRAQRSSAPWLCVAFALAGHAFGRDPTRRRTLTQALGRGVVVVAAIFGVSYLTQMLALAGQVGITLAAWTPFLLIAAMTSLRELLRP